MYRTKDRFRQPQVRVAARRSIRRYKRYNMSSDGRRRTRPPSRLPLPHNNTLFPPTVGEWVGGGVPPPSPSLLPHAWKMGFEEKEKGAPRLEAAQKQRGRKNERGGRREKEREELNATQESEEMGFLPLLSSHAPSTNTKATGWDWGGGERSNGRAQGRPGEKNAASKRSSSSFQPGSLGRRTVEEAAGKPSSL